MASVIIPAKNDGTQAYSMTIQLDFVNFRLAFAWNSQRSFWTMTLSDASGNILAVRKVVADTPLLARYIGMDDFPTGDILPMDTSGKGEDPGLYDLGTRVVLLYLSVQDILTPP